MTTTMAWSVCVDMGDCLLSDYATGRGVNQRGIQTDCLFSPSVQPFRGSHGRCVRSLGSALGTKTQLYFPGPLRRTMQPAAAARCVATGHCCAGLRAPCCIEADRGAIRVWIDLQFIFILTKRKCRESVR